MAVKFLLSHKLGIALAGISLAGAILFLLGLRVYRRFKYCHKALRELGFFQEERKEFTDPKTGTVRERVVKAKIKVRWNWSRTKLIFSCYNRGFSLEDFQRLKPKLEHNFGVKIDEISVRTSKIPGRQPLVVLHIESFRELLTLEECPKDLTAGQFWLGRTGLGTDLILDAVRKFQFSLGIFSQAGGGKGNLIAGAVQSLLDTWIKEKGNHPYFVLLLDAKGTDYLPLINKYGIKSLNPIFVEELREAVSILENYKNEVDEYRRYLAQNLNGQTITHWFEVREKFPELKPPIAPIFLIADECSQYLVPRPSLRITKDSSEEERQTKERYDLEAKLAFLINSILQLFRSSGAVVLVATQSSRETDLTLDRTNIRTLAIGQQNAQMSRFLTGDEKLATDSTLVRGKFLFVGDGVVRKFQTPFTLGEPPKKNGGRK